MLPLRSGRIEIAGERFDPLGPADAIRAGMGLVPNRRREEGLANGMTIRENLFINPAVRGVRWHDAIMRKPEREACDNQLRRLSVRPTEPELTISALSGGNQQKVVLARWFAIGARILILEEPTSGVDVGAKADVYRLIDDALSIGHAVLLISSDFEEVSGVCNRVLIFDRGQVRAELERSELSVEHITHMASGGSAVQAHMETLN
jgi:ribose transport system ATP-binding protein